MAKYHPGLVAAGVKVDMSVAHAKVNEETGEVIGTAIKIISLEDRVQGRGDALITIDGDRWADMSAAERMAVLDHELTHLQVQTEIVRQTPPKPGDGPVPVAPPEFKPRLDDHGRPKLKMRHHDHEFGWFDEVARRHAGASQEVQQAQRFADEFGQLYLWETAGSKMVADG